MPDTAMKDIETYIADRNPDAAKRVAAAIIEAAMRLEAFPYLGQPTHRSDVRELQVPRLPYLLPYRVRGEDVEILSVFDERMERPEEWV